MQIRFYSVVTIISLVFGGLGCATAQTTEKKPPDVFSKNKNIKLEDNSHTGEVVIRNGSVSIGNGAGVASIDTVNGSTQVGNHTEIASINTVNGNTLVGEDSKVQEMSSVNGSIGMGNRSAVARDIHSTNGQVALGDDAYVQGVIYSVNTSVSLGKRARAGQIVAENADVTLEEGARVERSIEVRKVSYNWFAHVIGVKERIPTITIGPNAQVGGDLVFTGKVVLRVHSTAKIGAVKGAEVQTY
jgi:UDP-3-O-[3-hydroxymyristoyl] glucosamine N-acyltransferase